MVLQVVDAVNSKRAMTVVAQIEMYSTEANWVRNVTRNFDALDRSINTSAQVHALGETLCLPMCRVT